MCKDAVRTTGNMQYAKQSSAPVGPEYTIMLQSRNPEQPPNRTICGPWRCWKNQCQEKKQDINLPRPYDYMYMLLRSIQYEIESSK